MRKLKIVIISTLWETTPPKLYGGTERIASYLTEELVKRGHDVTLFATGDSRTKAQLISTYPKALYRDNVPWTSYYDNLTLCGKALEYALKIQADIIHNHNLYYCLSFSNLVTIPIVHTIHGNISSQIIPPEKTRMLNNYKDLNYVSISNSQRKIRDLNYVATVYNGVPIADYKFYKEGGDNLVWLGRISAKKGTAEAIKIAKKLNKKLILAGKIDWGVAQDVEYYNQEVKPYLKKGKIEYVGEIDLRGKNELFRKAKVLLNLINWDEPFGLVPVESNASGAPVIATKKGAMVEIIKNGVNGFLVPQNNFEEAISRVKEIYAMPEKEYQRLRLTSRKHAEDHFTIEKMTGGYERIYQEIIQSRLKQSN